jgi:hypothetical protein
MCVTDANVLSERNMTCAPLGLFTVRHKEFTKLSPNIDVKCVTSIIQDKTQKNVRIMLTTAKTMTLTY